MPLVERCCVLLNTRSTIVGTNIETADEEMFLSLCAVSVVAVTYLSMLSPRTGGGGRASHGNLIVRSIPRVGILIERDQGLRDIWPPSLALVEILTNYFVPEVGNLNFF